MENLCAIRVHLQISIQQTYNIFLLDMSCPLYSIKCQSRGVPEVICAQRHMHSSHFHLNYQDKMQYFLKNFIEGRRLFVNREYVITEFNCQQIFAMVYLSASDKLLRG